MTKLQGRKRLLGLILLALLVFAGHTNAESLLIDHSSVAMFDTIEHSKLDTKFDAVNDTNAVIHSEFDAIKYTQFYAVNHSDAEFNTFIDTEQHSERRERRSNTNYIKRWGSFYNYGETNNKWLKKNIQFTS